MKALLVIFSCLFCLLSQNAFCQKLSTKNDHARDSYLKGVDFLNISNFDLAEENFQKAIKADARFVEAYLMLADIYNQQKNYTGETNALNQALLIDSTFFTPTFYNLGMAQFNLGKYDDATINLLKYREKTKDATAKAKTDRLLANISFAKNAIAHPINITPISLGDSINSSYDEYWPSLRGDEQELVFTVLVPRDSLLFAQRKLPRLPRYYQEDFYSSRRDSSGHWLLRKEFPSNINTNGNEGAQSLSVDGKWMFFTACGRPEGKGSCDIFFSVKTGIGWSKPVSLDYPVNTASYETQPSFSADGKTLYFISSRAGGIGGMDIWTAQIVGLKPDGVPVFANLLNLGDHINTKVDENSPFIHPDGKTLYFSSEGWTGMGQMDIYVSRLQANNEWSLPTNFGYPTNTSGDEVGFVLNAIGDRGYFSSNRFNNGERGKDIFSFITPDTLRPTPASYLKGRVFDYNTKQQLKASFELINLANSELTAQSTTNYKGEFLLCLPIGINYALNVSQPDYLFYSQNVNLIKSTTALAPIVMDIFLKPISKNAIVVLENVFFDTNSSQLQPESYAELAKLLAFMQMNPKVKIEISGHTDTVGTESLNIKLSLNRAQAVQNYLVDKGIVSTRLTSVGYGFTKPITSNDTEAGRAKNRRTEIKVSE